MKFNGGVRPITFETNPDGSTKRMFVQISDFHGFAVVVDFATHQELSRVTLPDLPGDQEHHHAGSPSHGIGITPDGKTLCEPLASGITSWRLFDARTSSPSASSQSATDPDWLTFSPDSKTVYVACAGSNSSARLDVKTLKEVDADRRRPGAGRAEYHQRHAAVGCLGRRGRKGRLSPRPQAPQKLSSSSPSPRRLCYPGNPGEMLALLSALV